MAEKANYKEFFVFIDDSNLWIPGQRVQGAKLHDADTDPRFRVDLGRLLNVLTGSNGTDSIFDTFLYGSFPPPNDTVWNAARKENFNVKTYRRSSSGKEKEIDVAMASDITETMCDFADGNSTFVIVTGDRDLKTPIDKALKRGIPVELWSWEQSLSLEYRRLANTNPSFRVHKLDDVEQHFSYKSYVIDTKRRRNIDPKHALVVKKIPEGKRSLHIVADSVSRLMRLFYITSRSFHDRDTQDLIIEFPNTKIEAVLSLLKKYEFEYEHCTYASYSSSLDHGMKPVMTTNRFEALSDIDDESLPEVVESSLSLDPDEISDSCADSEFEDNASTIADDAASVSSGGSWVDVVKQKKFVKKVGDISCHWGVHCIKGSDCKYKHTEYETAIFCRYPKIKFKYWKGQLCNKREQHLSEEQRKWCAFAHDDRDSWCLKCKMFGHLTKTCAV